MIDQKLLNHNWERLICVFSRRAGKTATLKKIANIFGGKILTVAEIVKIKGKNGFHSGWGAALVK